MSDHNFTSFVNRIRTVTFVEILATVSIAMLFVSIVILFEVKTAFLQRQLASDHLAVVSPNSSKLMLSNIDVDVVERFARSHAELAAVGVVGVNLAENTRTMIVAIYNDQTLKRLHQKHNIYAGSYPLFTADSINNSEITSLIEGRFTCAPSIIGPGGDVTEIRALVKTTCRVPVPPYYGKVTGYLVFYSSKELSIYEVDRLRRDALRLAIDIYYMNSTSVTGSLSRLHK